MLYDSEREHRQSSRLPGHDYSSPGWYFVTICTHKRKSLFGSLTDDRIDLSAFGHLIEVSWHEIPEHFLSVEIDRFIVMPNHLHGIVFLDSPHHIAHHFPTKEQFGGPVSGSLPTIIRSFKSATTKAINELLETSGTTVRQRAYHDPVDPKRTRTPGNTSLHPQQPKQLARRRRKPDWADVGGRHAVPISETGPTFRGRSDNRYKPVGTACRDPTSARFIEGEIPRVIKKHRPHRVAQPRAHQLERTGGKLGRNVRGKCCCPRPPG